MATLLGERILFQRFVVARVRQAYFEIIARRAYCVGVQKSLFVSVSVLCCVVLSEVRFGHDFERFRAGKRRFRGQKTVKKWLFLGF